MDRFDLNKPKIVKSLKHIKNWFKKYLVYSPQDIEKLNVNNLANLLKFKIIGHEKPYKNMNDYQNCRLTLAHLTYVYWLSKYLMKAKIIRPSHLNSFLGNLLLEELNGLYNNAKELKSSFKNDLTTEILFQIAHINLELDKKDLAELIFRDIFRNNLMVIDKVIMYNIKDYVRKRLPELFIKLITSEAGNPMFLIEGLSVGDLIYGSFMFIDISGFTQIGNDLEEQYGEHSSSANLSEFLNYVFSKIFEVLEVGYINHDISTEVVAWVDKIVADEIVIHFIDKKNFDNEKSLNATAKAAVQVASNIYKSINNVNAEDSLKNYFPDNRDVSLGVKTGIASGHARFVSVGHFGTLFDYTLISNSVTLASRLESLKSTQCNEAELCSDKDICFKGESGSFYIHICPRTYNLISEDTKNNIHFSEHCFKPKGKAPQHFFRFSPDFQAH